MSGHSKLRNSSDVYDSIVEKIGDRAYSKEHWKLLNFPEQVAEMFTRYLGNSHNMFLQLGRREPEIPRVLAAVVIREKHLNPPIAALIVADLHEKNLLLPRETAEQFAEDKVRDARRCTLAKIRDDESKALYDFANLVIEIWPDDLDPFAMPVDWEADLGPLPKERATPPKPTFVHPWAAEIPEMKTGYCVLAIKDEATALRLAQVNQAVIMEAKAADFDADLRSELAYDPACLCILFRRPATDLEMELLHNIAATGHDLIVQGLAAAQCEDLRVKLARFKIQVIDVTDIN